LGQDSNIILSNSFEYRLPSPAAEQAAIEKARASGQASGADMTSRFVGLIVIPGKQIEKVEVEEKREWASSQLLAVRPRS
jgi:N-alpha-acetyltransferase 38, NatC auxiliary subunit